MTQLRSECHQKAKERRREWVQRQRAASIAASDVEVRAPQRVLCLRRRAPHLLRPIPARAPQPALLQEMEQLIRREYAQWKQHVLESGAQRRRSAQPARPPRPAPPRLAPPAASSPTRRLAHPPRPPRSSVRVARGL